MSDAWLNISLYGDTKPCYGPRINTVGGNHATATLRATWILCQPHPNFPFRVIGEIANIVMLRLSHFTPQTSPQVYRPPEFESFSFTRTD